MSLAVSTYHMSGYRTDVVNLTVFCADDVTITHQYHVMTVNLDDAVYHITTVLHPGEYHITHLGVIWFLEDDTLLATNNKRKHAVAFDG